MFNHTSGAVRERRGSVVAVGSIAMLVMAGIAVVACSTESPADDGKVLDGRYAISSTSTGAPSLYETMFFSSKDNTFEGRLRNCSTNCIKKGTFTYARGDLAVTSTDGGPDVRLRITPTEDSGTLQKSSVRIRADVPGGSVAAANPCGGNKTASLGPRGTSSGASPDCDSLLGPASTLLDFIKEFLDKETGAKGVREGSERPSEVVAQNPNCNTYLANGCRYVCGVSIIGIPAEYEDCSKQGGTTCNYLYAIASIGSGGCPVGYSLTGRRVGTGEQCIMCPEGCTRCK